MFEYVIDLIKGLVIILGLKVVFFTTIGFPVFILYLLMSSPKKTNNKK